MKKGILLFCVSFYLQYIVAQQTHINTLEKKITILYTNDQHSHVEPHKVQWISTDRLVGGFANIATLMKKEKATNPNVLYLDVGDYFCGPYISLLTNWVLQVSRGIEMEFDEQKNTGQRITKCHFNGKPFEDDKNYKILTSNFLADGGDGFMAFKLGKNVKKTTVEILQTMVNYLKTFEYYSRKIEGRVIKL